jgi:uncharacterized protein YdbL (DUF1318 family)
MKTLVRSAVLVLSAALYACVTVNVYFPAAAVEQAADRIVKEVYGEKVKKMQENGEIPEAAPPASNDQSGTLSPLTAVAFVLEALVPPAYAQQPDIDVDSPTINKLKASMQARHPKLVPFYNAGAIGLASTGLLAVRDAKAVSLKDRSVVQSLVAEENQDRNALYREIAAENGHPEWEPQIRTIFDKRWVANAPSGTWFQNADGGWMQK